MKRPISFLLVLILAISLGGVYAAAADAVIPINDKADLAKIAADLSADYELTKDIVFEDADFAPGGDFYNDGAGFLPIGIVLVESKQGMKGEAMPFTGTLQGNGHTISGLTANVAFGKEPDYTYLGLFADNQGVISNLTLRDLNLYLDKQDAENTFSITMFGGGIAAKNSGRIESCTVNGTLGIHARSIESVKGGIISKLGGIVGENSGIVMDCAVAADLKCFAYGDANTHRLGGIAGENQNGGTITRCYYNGKMEYLNTKNSSFAGALVGYQQANGGDVTDSYVLKYDSTPSDFFGTKITNYVRCAFVEPDQKGNRDSFPALNFDSVWDISEDGPFLRGHAHTWDDGKETTAPTCGAAGVKKYTCTEFGATREESIPATEAHNYDNGKVTTKPTCVGKGVKTFTCAVCGTTRTESIGATGEHTWDKGQVTTKPTTAKAGKRTYTCTVCGTTKTEQIPKLKTDATAQFVDVKKGEWYVGAVNFAVENGLFKGVTDTTFEPDSPMTRAMFVTVLGRLNGVKVDAKATTKFKDVRSSAYYAGYVKWAADSGIVSGTGATTFSPDDNVTREQICKMMVEYCAHEKIALKKVNKEANFKDAGKISSWAKTYVKKAQTAGFVNGDKAGYFDPQGNATRAQVAQIFMNFDDNYGVVK